MGVTRFFRDTAGAPVKVLRVLFLNEQRFPSLASDILIFGLLMIPCALFLAIFVQELLFVIAPPFAYGPFLASDAFRVFFVPFSYPLFQISGEGFSDPTFSLLLICVII